MAGLVVAEGGCEAPVVGECTRQGVVAVESAWVRAAGVAAKFASLARIALLELLDRKRLTSAAGAPNVLCTAVRPLAMHSRAELLQIVSARSMKSVATNRSNATPNEID